MRSLAIVACLVAFSPATAQTVYRCTDSNGNPVFSQTPCSPAAEEHRIRVIEPSAAEKAAAADRLARTPSSSLEGDERVCLLRAERAAYAVPNRQLREHERRLSILEARTRYAANNLAGATYEAGLREEKAGIHQAMAAIRSAADQAYYAAAQRCHEERARREAALAPEPFTE